MHEYLKLKKSNCKNCYKCIRHCPVKSIRFSGNQAHIVEDECILCGQCFVSCPQNAKEIRSDIPAAKELIAAGHPVYASVAPSFVANYPGITIREMEAALKSLGFFAAEETAIGATAVKNAYDRMLRENERDVIISSCCHSVNLLIQKYYPGALACLARVLSPMQTHCLMIKKSNPDAKTVFIGPCISKKEEANQYKGIVDCVLTFEELSGWLSSSGIVLQPFSGNEDAPLTQGRTGKTRLFPVAGGILRTMDCDAKEYVYLAVDGIENCIHAIEDIVDGNLSKCFIEMSACAGGCVGGPAMSGNRRAPVRDYLSVNSYAGKKDFEQTMPSEEEMKKNIPFIGLHKQMPGSAAIAEILKKMGKREPEQELNCGSCGYNSCREKAAAVLQGKADLNMCLPYLKERAESFSDTIIRNTPNGIIVLNEMLEVQQINAAACGIVNIRNPGDILGEHIVSILDPQTFLEVQQKGRNIHDKRVYLAEYHRYVEQTVIHDRSYHIIISILRDVTAEEAERSQKENISRQTMDIADKVIQKQMRVVQEIASLLGETTAETKIALTKLKESLNNE